MSSGGGNSGKESRRKSAQQQQQRDALVNSSCFASTASWSLLSSTTREAAGDDEEEIPRHIAHFTIDEIQKDTCCYCLGKYSESFLIRGINQTHRASDPLHQFSRDWLTRRLFFGRSSSTISTTTTGDCKFVIKHIRPEFMHSGSQEEFEKAASYLANEASMLQTLRQHSGISSLLGTSIDSTEAYYTHGGRPDAFFIIHERVVESLEQRILKWKDKLARIKAFQLIGGIFWNSTRREEEFMATRLGVAYEIADALAYMHRNSVAYRNFGMDKVGFNRNKKMQLIDLGDADKLGLARVHEEYGENNPRTTTTALQETLSLNRGKEGSFRDSSISSSQQTINTPSLNASSYTAPEMMISGGDEGKFSEKSVSFSFTKLLSELLTLIVVGWHPSKKVTAAYINEFQRISCLLSKDLLQQLHQGISVNPHIRPTMEKFVEAINLGLRAIAGKNKEQLQRSSSDHSSFASSSRSSAPRRRVTWHDHGSSLLRSSKSPASLPAGNIMTTQDGPPAAGS